MFYVFTQRATNGENIHFDPLAGISRQVVIEAESLSHAKARAGTIGLFHAHQTWDIEETEHNAETVGEEIGALETTIFSRFSLFVHFEDGVVEEYR